MWHNGLFKFYCSPNKVKLWRILKLQCNLCLPKLYKIKELPNGLYGTYIHSSVIDEMFHYVARTQTWLFKKKQPLTDSLTTHFLNKQEVGSLGNCQWGLSPWMWHNVLFKFYCSPNKVKLWRIFKLQCNLCLPKLYKKKNCLMAFMGLIFTAA